MILAIDFDNTIVSQDRAYNDLDTPLEFMPGAKEALESLRNAGHTVVVYSARANRALREDWQLNPLWRDGKVPFDLAWWERNRELNEARWHQMLEFLLVHLPWVSVDDGKQGKPSADLYIDDKALKLGRGADALDWFEIAETFGEAEGTWAEQSGSST